MVEAAKAQGINGVPFVIIDGKWAVNGLQPVECFIQVSYPSLWGANSTRQLIRVLTRSFVNWHVYLLP